MANRKDILEALRSGLRYQRTRRTGNPRYDADLPVGVLSYAVGYLGVRDPETSLLLQEIVQLAFPEEPKKEQPEANGALSMDNASTKEEA